MVRLSFSLYGSAELVACPLRESPVEDFIIRSGDFELNGPLST